MEKTLGKTFLKNFQQQTQPQQVQSNIIPAPNPLSTKTGLNKTKVTSMQQGMLQALAQPQGMMNQKGSV